MRHRRVLGTKSYFRVGEDEAACDIVVFLSRLLTQLSFYIVCHRTEGLTARASKTCACVLVSWIFLHSGHPGTRST